MTGNNPTEINGQNIQIIGQKAKLSDKNERRSNNKFRPKSTVLSDNKFLRIIKPIITQMSFFGTTEAKLL